jgi:hypothetical protein
VSWGGYRQRKEKEGEEKGHTPSQATIKNSSDWSRVVSVVYGAPTTNSFIDASPSERVTASTPDYQ